MKISIMTAVANVNMLGSTGKAQRKPNLRLVGPLLPASTWHLRKSLFCR